MSELLKILLVDDEAHSLQSMRMALEDEFEIFMAQNIRLAKDILKQEDIKIIFCDQRMPETTGVEFLEGVRLHQPDIIRIIITGFSETNDMIDAINKAGIYQFITKPWHPEHLLMVARNAAQLSKMSDEHAQLSQEMGYLASNVQKKLKARQKALQNGLGFETILCTPSSPLNDVLNLAKTYAPYDVSVFIKGEVSVGKSRLARAIHYSSLRAEQKFVHFSCLGMNVQEFERALYGYRRGYLPGQNSGKQGLLQKADKGSFYLDNIDRLPIALQEQLLRVIRTQSFTALGAFEAQKIDVRFIVSSSENLEFCVEKGLFLAELYNYLAVGVLEISPLRSRKDDIALLALNYLQDVANRHGKLVAGFDDVALSFLENYSWPGNLAELENEITRMVIKAQSDTLGAELISRHILQAEHSQSEAQAQNLQSDMLCDGSLKERIETIEARILRETLTRLKWNKTKAADELGLSRVGLRAKLERYGIELAENQIVKN